MSRKKIVVCLIIAVISLIAYWPVQDHDFINLDDDLYITGNQKVKAGLTLDGIAWAFSFNEKGYWQPLTWLSHMLDVELFGLNPAGHHLANLIIHIASALLLFWFLYRGTGRLYRCAFLATLFALHPLNVDSVAWAAERKNLLSSFFWMLSLLFYVRYAEKPNIKRYGLTWVTFIIGLMVKPMLVTLPFVFLLLDYWPLRRLVFHRRRRSADRDPQKEGPNKRQLSLLQAVMEKVPFLLFSGLSVWISIVSTQQMGIVVAGETVPMTMRFANAVVSYFSYLAKIFWPHNLAIFYPFPKALPMWQVAGCGVLMLAFSAFVLLKSRAKPYLATGWFWYLGTLVPVIGIIQAGEWPALADRWAYIPMIGIMIVGVWGADEITAKWRFKTPALIVTAIVVLVGCVIAVRMQLPYWQNSRVLFAHAVEITEKNGLAHNNLGSALLWDGQYDAALQQFQAAVKIRPDSTKIHNNIAHALVKLGRVDEAIERYVESLKLNPKEAATHNSLAVVLLEKWQIAEAIQHLQTALRLEPDYADAYVNLGSVYRRQGKNKMATRYYLQAIRLQPDLPEAYNNLGLLLLKAGKLQSAAANFHKSLEIRPDFKSARENLKKVQTAQTAYRQTLTQLKDKIKNNPDDADLYMQLGDLYKDQGTLNQALENYQKAFLIRPESRPVMKKLAIGHAMTGNYDPAVELLRKMIAQQPNDTEPYIYIAGIYARQNKAAESIEWLKRAIARGYHNWDRLKRDSNFDNIRENASFKALGLPKS